MVDSLTSNELPQPGAIQLDQIEISSPKASQPIDIKNLIEEFSIYEHVNQPFMSADFLITDASSLFTVLPLTGIEDLNIAFSIPHPAYTKTVNINFRITGIYEIMPGPKVRYVKYILRCSQPEAIKDWSSRIRKSYANMTVGTMVKNICSDVLGITNLNLSDSAGLRTIVIPNMHPSDAFKFLSREAKSQTYAPSNYTFFSNADGYYFKTVEELLTGTATDKYYLTEKNYWAQDNPLGNAHSLGGALAANLGSKPLEFMKVIDYRFLNTFDLERDMKRGVFDNTLFVLDPVVSLFQKKTYNYLSDYGKFKRVDPNGGKFIFADSDIGYLSGDSHHRFILSDEGHNTANPDTKADYLHYLAASVAMLDYVTLEITVPGDCSRRVGDMVQISFPEFSMFDNTIDKENLFLSGNYLVVAIRHSYTVYNQGYKLVMQVIKNNYRQGPEASATLNTQAQNVSGNSVFSTTAATNQLLNNV